MCNFKDPYEYFIKNWPILIDKKDAETNLFLNSLPPDVFIDCLRTAKNRIMELNNIIKDMEENYD